jgi:hypothetical protein
LLQEEISAFILIALSFTATAGDVKAAASGLALFQK